MSEYICYNRKLNITLNFMFRMYDQKCTSVTSHALDPPSSCHKLSHLLGPPPLERDLLYGRPLSVEFHCLYRPNLAPNLQGLKRLSGQTQYSKEPTK